jgi:squalene-hopene/tetraprenyl-beta-curcumene cyclase
MLGLTIRCPRKNIACEPIQRSNRIRRRTANSLADASSELYHVTPMNDEMGRVFMLENQGQQVISQDQPRDANMSSGDAVTTLRRAADWLLDHQDPQGFWVGMVETNSAMEAEWLLCSHILGIKLPIEEGVIRALLKRQRDDGSWEVYHGAPEGDVNSTIEVYAALTAKGMPPDSPQMMRARQWIVAHDGMRKVRVFTRYWLALVGVWPWQATPNLPPEIIRFPRWFPFSIYNFASWARATIVPLAIICARRPVFPLPDGSKLEELFPGPYADFDFTLSKTKPGLLTVDRLFVYIDRALHALQTFKLVQGRENSIKLCLEWMIRHQDADGAWGGIQPPWIYAVMALHNEGYALDHPALAKAVSALSAHWSFERDGGITIQATDSCCWDTLFALFSLHEAGVAMGETPQMQRALEWILDHEVRHRGDWAMTAGPVEPGGWSFERANIHYPDIDDTALALLVLARLAPDAGKLRPSILEAIERGTAWTLAMQSDNGGWAAFDKNNNKEIVCKIPFCNFGEALDPPSADVTAHVIEAFAALGMSAKDKAVAKALAFIRAEQEDDGSWFGRWGVNHIYGTGAVLPALEAIGDNMSQDYVRRAAAWLMSKQNADGGWGESCASYMDASARGRGPSTASQTAWALMALLAAGGLECSDAIQKGIRYLAATQRQDGTWDEDFYTGTGFPGYGAGARLALNSGDLAEKLQQGPELSRGFMLNYNLYRHYFPILALARAAKAGFTG